MRLFFTLTVLVILSSCVDKVICPAFQSTYILDDSVRSVYYSYLWKLDEGTRLEYLADQRPTTTDSSGAVVSSLGGEGVDYFAYVEPYIVPPREVKKTKNGIASYEPYWLKNYRQRTAPMENLLTPDPIERDTVVDVGEFVASDFSDSVSLETDSLSVAIVETDSTDEDDFFELPTIAKVEPPKPKTEVQFLYRYDPKDKMLNVEQEYYNKHFGQYLYVNKAVNYDTATTSTDSLDTKSGWLKQFIQNLFDGKNTSKESLVAEETTSEVFEEPSGDATQTEEGGD